MNTPSEVLADYRQRQVKELERLRAAQHEFENSARQYKKLADEIVEGLKLFDTPELPNLFTSEPCPPTPPTEPSPSAS